MKKLLLWLSIAPAVPAYAQGYEIKITFKPYKNEYIYLGHYFGKTYPVIDSAKLDNNSVAVFRGSKKLQPGTYLIGYPHRQGFFELLIDKEQHIAVIADTSTIRNGVQFINSPENDQLKSYQQYVSAKGREIDELQGKLPTAKGKDSVEIITKIKKLDKEIIDFR